MIWLRDYRRLLGKVAVSETCIVVTYPVRREYHHPLR